MHEILQILIFLTTRQNRNNTQLHFWPCQLGIML